MITYEEALRLLLAGALPLPARHVPLAEASGGVAAADVCSRLSVPGFANAAMDGYALRAAGTRDATPEAPVMFDVCGLIPAGSAPLAARPGDDAAGRAFEILTGAPMPAMADAVVPLERVTRFDAEAHGLPRIRVSGPVEEGRNVRKAGEDFVEGQAVIRTGTRLLPHHLMALAACGIDSVDVRARPRVAVLTTGSELATRGSDLAAGQIRDANGPYLRALLPLLGATLAGDCSATDDRRDLRDRLRELASGADVVLTTGGVSAGRLDLLPEAVRSLGGQIVFHKVAIRPGKPVLHARLPGGALLFGLPGNPLAVAVGMRFFVIPVLRALQGLPREES